MLPSPFVADRMEEGSMAPAQRNRRVRVKRLDYWSAGDQAIDDDNHRDNEQKVDESAANMHDEESKNPENKQNYRDGPKHDGILARSELHPARQTVSPAWRAATRPGVMVPHALHDGNLHACNVREAGGEASNKQIALRRNIIVHAA